MFGTDVFSPERPYTPLKLHFGAPDPDKILGRDEDALHFWEALESGSLRLIAERRMGKTWLLRRAVAMKPAWARALFLDVEGHKHIPELVRDLNRMLHDQGLIDVSWWRRAQDWFRRSLSRFGHVKVPAVELGDLDPWPDFLRDTCRQAQPGDAPVRVVVIFDEFPSFLDNLLKSGEAAEAARLLDVLRALRQEHAWLRLVYCGSLGLHVVLDRLRDGGYSGRPVNDMPPFEAGPLAEDWARYLAGCLLVGEGVDCHDVTACSRAVAGTACGVPFYVQHIVKWLKDRPSDGPWTADRITAVPELAAAASGDPFEFAYYDGRIDIYYRDLDMLADRARIALDVLSRRPDGLPFGDLLNLVRHSPGALALDPEGLLGVLNTLREDHYLVQVDGHWRFKFEIVRRAWKARRGDQGL